MKRFVMWFLSPEMGFFFAGSTAMIALAMAMTGDWTAVPYAMLSALCYAGARHILAKAFYLALLTAQVEAVSRIMENTASAEALFDELYQRAESL